MKLIPTVVMTFPESEPCLCGGTLEWQLLEEAESWVCVCLECGEEQTDADGMGLL